MIPLLLVDVLCVWLKFGQGFLCMVQLVMQRMHSDYAAITYYNICRCFEYIEEMIHKQEPLVSVLRLLILFSVTNSGLPKRHFDYLRYLYLISDLFLSFFYEFSVRHIIAMLF